jgi:hypothetical protein
LIFFVFFQVDKNFSVISEFFLNEGFFLTDDILDLKEVWNGVFGGKEEFCVESVEFLEAQNSENYLLNSVKVV